MTRTLLQHPDDLFITSELFWGGGGTIAQLWPRLLLEPWQGLSWLLTGATQFMSLTAETAWENQTLIVDQRLGLTKAIKEKLARADLSQSQPVRPGCRSGEAPTACRREHTHVLAGARLHFVPSPFLTLPHRRGACGGRSHSPWRS